LEKDNIIYKLNIKDYNNNLEKILVTKDFPEDAKNLLLSMLYKIENSYDDYKKVKVNVKLKKEILQEITEIIEHKCNKIEIVKPNEDVGGAPQGDLCKSIVTHLDEKELLYKVIELGNNKFFIDDKYVLIKKYLEKALIEGYVINLNEIIRDFDGWAWNITVKNINNLTYNFLYQTILILLGNDFIEEWKYSKKENIEKLIKELKRNNTDENIEEILKVISQICIIEYILFNNSEKQSLIEKQEELQKNYDEINNKKTYLQKLANNKKEIGKRIKDIDSLLSDDYKLKTEFINKNQLLGAEERIFSLSDFVENLQQERIELIKNLDIYANMMKPANYIEEKHKIYKDLSLLKEIELNKDIQEKQKELITRLVNLTYRSLSDKIKKAQIKKEIIELFYCLRYYKFIPICKKEFIKDIEKNKKELETLEKELITKACNIKGITIFSKNIKENFEIVKEVLNTKIIDLEKVYIELKKQKENIKIIIYDENNVENISQLNILEEINVKYNKKIKLFN